MLNLKLIVVGKIKEQFLKDEINEYLKRLSRYCKINIVEVQDEKIKDNPSLKEEEIVKKEEGNRILKHIKDEYVILLDLHGEQLTSIEFANKLDLLTSKHSICFVIAGSLGYSSEVINRANYRLCLSKMTFTHQMTRVIILEQIYRAFKILKNEIYHK